MVKKHVTRARAILVVEIALVSLLCWIVLSSTLTGQPDNTVQASSQDGQKALKQKRSQERFIPPEGIPEANSVQAVDVAAPPTTCSSFDFAGGATQGFTVVSAFGTPQALWHATNGLCRASLAGHSTPYDFYYGQDGTCNYNTGARNAANLISPSISLAGSFAPFSVSFNYLLFVEGGGFDSTFVDISTDGGTTWTQILSKANLINDNQWHNIATDVTGTVGGASAVKLRFRFDSVDNIANSTTGWHVDDIMVCGAAFNFCVQNDNGGDFLQFNSITGHYITRQCNTGFVAEGTGTVTASGGTITLKENGPVRFVTATVNTSTHTGNAQVKVRNGLSIVGYNINDSNTDNNTCTCP